MFVIANSTGSLFWNGKKFARDASGAKTYETEANAKRALSRVTTSSGRPRLIVLPVADALNRRA